VEEFEKLGVFYLGREYDLQTKAPLEDLLLYDSKDLVTHGVCVGMTGSGKTGLCIGLIEEAALDGVPAIVIDPKGDLADLMLTFPDLRPQDFRPWINEEDAARKGLTPDDFARQQAELWAKGLADWGESGDRIRRLRDSADFAIYTPGSSAGLPISILASFAAPAAAVRDDPELLGDRIATTATSLLALLGIDADPIQSREHILLSTILYTAWQQGQNLDLAALIGQIQNPPVTTVGVMDLESFYPSKERFELAMRMNNLLAAPGFAAWMEGEPLDVARLLHTPEGKPRVSIMSIAHLSDAERMFFVSLLLNEVLGWMRSQPGTGSLRALIYMDEIFGFFPPVAEPPSKRPLLTLLKQARAFGVGILLATQNPVDLDYKGLSNAGTWFIGRLQTDNDKQRVLAGLEGVAAGATAGFDRQAMEQTLAGLGNRVFLMYNAHEDAPVVFTTRWTMSYLRGPLTRTQIKTLMDPRKAAGAGVGATAVAAAPAPAPTTAVSPTPLPSAEAGPATIAPSVVSAIPAGPTSEQGPTSGLGSSKPLLPPGVPEYFLPVRGARPEGGSLRYRPALLGAAGVHIADAKLSLDHSLEVTALTPVTTDPVPVDWERAQVVTLALEDLDKHPADGAAFGALPSAAAKATSYDDYTRGFISWVYQTQSLQLLRSPALKQVSRPGESEGEFRVRLQQAAREQRDVLKDRLQEKYTPKLAALDERVRRAQQAVDREGEEARGAQMQTAISVGATVLGALFGRKKFSSATIGKATTAARGVGRSMDQAGDVGRAKDTVESLKQQSVDLQAEFQAEVDALDTTVDPQSEVFELVTVRPKKADVAVKLVALAWVPAWVDAQGGETQAFE